MLYKFYRPHTLDRPDLFFIFFGSIVLIVGLILYRYFLKRVKMAKRSTDWSEITGTILESKIARTGVHRFKIKPVIKYEYEINKNKFTNNWIIIGNLFIQATPLEIYTLIKRYPVHSATKIYYDPNRPQHAVLIPGIQPIHKFFSNFFVIYFIGVSLVVLTGFIMFIFR